MDIYSKGDKDNVRSFSLTSLVNKLDLLIFIYKFLIEAKLADQPIPPYKGIPGVGGIIVFIFYNLKYVKKGHHEPPHTIIS